jgi:hypothetical protein
MALIVAVLIRHGGRGEDSRADAAVARQGLRAAGGAPARNVPLKARPVTGASRAAPGPAHPARGASPGAAASQGAARSARP